MLILNCDDILYYLTSLRKTNHLLLSKSPKKKNKTKQNQETIINKNKNNQNKANKMNEPYKQEQHEWKLSEQQTTMIKIFYTNRFSFNWSSDRKLEETHGMQCDMMLPS